MEYVVSMFVTGYHGLFIDAKNKKEAKAKALTVFENADYGAIENIDVEISNTILAGDDFIVSMRVTGTHEVTVEAESEEEAVKKAVTVFEEADYGVLCDLECEIKTVWLA